MKTITIQTRIINDEIQTAMKHSGFGEESIESILLTIGILDNLKQSWINKLNNEAKKI